MENQGNQGRTLDRVLDVLECVTSSREALSLTQIARLSSLHIATAKRIIGQLSMRDYLRSSPQGYTLGPRVLPMAHTFVSQDRLALIAPSVLRDLSAHTSLTSSVFVRSANERVMIARIEAPTPLSYQFPVGQLLSLFIGGGKVLLAYATQEERDQLLEGYENIELADGRIQDLKSLQQDLDGIRDNGYFIGHSERHRGTLSLTMPIWSDENLLLGSINLVADGWAIEQDGITKHHTALLQASRRIAMQM